MATAATGLAPLLAISQSNPVCGHLERKHIDVADVIQPGTARWLKHFERKSVEILRITCYLHSDARNFTSFHMSEMCNFYAFLNIQIILLLLIV
jgi:hypothetical protein